MLVRANATRCDRIHPRKCHQEHCKGFLTSLILQHKLSQPPMAPMLGRKLAFTRGVMAAPRRTGSSYLRFPTSNYRGQIHTALKGFLVTSTTEYFHQPELRLTRHRHAMHLVLRAAEDLEIGQILLQARVTAQ